MRTRSAFAILALFLIFAGHSAAARTVKTERVRSKSREMLDRHFLWRLRLK